MIRELKESYSYKRVMTLLSVLSFISGIAFSLLGELLLPLAVAFYAALIIFENKQRRILSYLIPLLTLAISLLYNGLYGIIAIEYILMALILVLVYTRYGSKAECAIYLTVIASVFIFISLYLGAARTIGDFSFTAVAAYYGDIYSNLKNQMISYLISIPQEDKTVINEGNLEEFFVLLSNMLVSVFAIVSFVLSGIAIKIFFALILKYSKNGVLKTFLHFLPSNLVAYSYIAVTVIYLLSDSDSLFSLSAFNIYEILMFVFAYVGARFIWIMGKFRGRKTFIFAMIASLLLFTGLAVQLLSYIGVWITVSTNKNLKYFPQK